MLFIGHHRVGAAACPSRFTAGILPSVPKAASVTNGASNPTNSSLPDLIRSVKAQGLEGLVAKRRDSRYEPGLGSGAWQKMRVNQGQESVIAGYTPSLKNFDALVIVYYEGDKLMYAAGPAVASRRHRERNCSRRSSRWKSKECPFANLRRKSPDVGAPV